MIYLSDMQEYAVVFLRELRKGDGWVPGADLAAAAGVSKDSVHQVMRCLVAAGLVKTLAGTGGGYQLRDRRHKATVLDVVEALPQRGRAGGGLRERVAERVAERVRATLAGMPVDEL